MFYQQVFGFHCVFLVISISVSLSVCVKKRVCVYVRVHLGQITLSKEEREERTEVKVAETIHHLFISSFFTNTHQHEKTVKHKSRGGAL